MKKIMCMGIIAFLTTAIFAADVDATIVLSKVEIKAGNLFVAVFDSAEAMKKNKPAATLKLESKAETVTANVSLPVGEYYISAYQDLNNNGKLDTNFIGIPKEPVGISNYSGSGIPGGFDKHKVLIDPENLQVTIMMKKI